MNSIPCPDLFCVWVSVRSLEGEGSILFILQPFVLGTEYTVLKKILLLWRSNIIIVFQFLLVVYLHSGKPSILANETYENSGMGVGEI